MVCKVRGRIKVPYPVPTSVANTPLFIWGAEEITSRVELGKRYPPADLGFLGYIITQPALDDVPEGFYPSSDTEDEVSCISIPFVFILLMEGVYILKLLNLTAL